MDERDSVAQHDFFPVPETHRVASRNARAAKFPQGCRMKPASGGGPRHGLQSILSTAPYSGKTAVCRGLIREPAKLRKTWR